MKENTLDKLLFDQKQKQDVALVTLFHNGSQCLVYPDSLTGDLALSVVQLKQVRSLLSTGTSKTIGEDKNRMFIRSYVSPFRLILIGAVHIAQALVPMARAVGFEITVIDPRASFCQQGRFDCVKLIHGWPDDILPTLELDQHTAIVTLSHDPKIDDPALRVALKSNALYIGSLGSSRTHEKRKDRLTECGFSKEINRIHSPVGLSLGGREHSEIAVSILAEIIQVRHEGLKP